MIETFNNPDLFGDLGLEADPTNAIEITDKETQDAKDKLNNLVGIAKTTEQSAEELSKLLLGEDKDETKEEKKEDDKEPTKEGETKEEKPTVSTSEEEKQGQSYSFKAIVEYLDEEGVLSFDEDLKSLEDTPEILSQVISKEIKSGVQKYKESLPDVVNQLVEYIELGGDPAKYLDSLYKPLDVKELDLGQEQDQELVVREYLKSQELSREEIDELIESYKDGLVLEKQAKMASKRVEAMYNKQTEQLIKEQSAIIEENNRKSQEYVENIKSTITTSKSLAGLDISEKEKKDFQDYILKVNPKTNMTKYQEDLAKDYVKNSVELAYLKFKNYDFTKAKQAGKSEATKEIRDKIFTKNEKPPVGKTATEAQAVDFSAFRSMFSSKK
jgi:hypothetical protein